MEKSQLPFLTVAALAHLIKTHEVSPVEVVEAYLERIERLNPQLHAFLTVCHEDARRAAGAAAQEMAHGAYRGPLHGIPFAVKDQLSTRGIRTTAGSPIFGDVVPDEDATVIAKRQQAGAILLGKLNMTEFGTTGFSHQFATPRNPWDLARYTGGSSSGSGAATAACQVWRDTQDALLPRLTPARVRCSLPADAVVARSSALEAAALAALEQLAPPAL
jgi:Asp-tRNA(Asn)/Glu-tRNA(Gln) amidotransferase A subunit family amidase